MTLKELYDRGTDVREHEIPDKWKESFDRFMMGQICKIEHREDGSHYFVYYSHDFRIWYHQNQTQIEREEKINSIIKK